MRFKEAIHEFSETPPRVPLTSTFLWLVMDRIHTAAGGSFLQTSSFHLSSGGVGVVISGGVGVVIGGGVGVVIRVAGHWAWSGRGRRAAGHWTERWPPSHTVAWLLV